MSWRLADESPLTAAALTGTPHGFWGRFAADDGGAAGMARYRSAVERALCPGGALVMLRQTHSADCLAVSDAWAYPDRPEGDALATDRPGMVLGIVTADCAPVLLADKEAGVIGAAHAGWRGALNGVLANTVAAMRNLGARPSRIVAAIGPTIARASYEVDAPFRGSFTGEASAFFTPGRPGRYRFDLPAYVASRLREAGVGRIEDLARDTYALEERFHSFRRSSHRGRDDAGRQISAIALC